MRKIMVTLVVATIFGACTNQEVVQYNTDRLNHVEEYLREHKAVKSGEALDKLVEEKTIEYSEEFKSLEKEAEAWMENQQK